MEVVLYKLAYYYLILSNNDRLLSSKVISILSSKEVVLLPLVRSNRTSLSTISVNRAIYSI